MYCKKCYKEVQDDWKYCPNCKSNLQYNKVQMSAEEVEKKHEEEKNTSIICLSLFILGIVGALFIAKINGLCFLVSLISITVGFLKCPNIKFIRIIFWIFLSLIILFIFAMLFALLYCIGIGVDYITRCGV